MFYLNLTLQISLSLQTLKRCIWSLRINVTNSMWCPYLMTLNKINNKLSKTQIIPNESPSKCKTVCHITNKLQCASRQHRCMEGAWPSSVAKRSSCYCLWLINKASERTNERANEWTKPALRQKPAPLTPVKKPAQSWFVCNHHITSVLYPLTQIRYINFMPIWFNINRYLIIGMIPWKVPSKVILLFQGWVFISHLYFVQDQT